MHTRKDINFKSDKLTLRGWLYTPDDTTTPTPGIIMAHGFSGLKEHGLDQFASAFANHGFTVLVYDNRNFGDSDGTPRQEVDPQAQVVDMRNAISFMQTLNSVDSEKIGIWGASLSASVGLVTAALDSRVRCLCVQVPKLDAPNQKVDSFIEKLMQQHTNQDPSSVMSPVAAADKHSFALIDGQHAYDFFTSVDNWQNQVTLASVKNTAYFSAADYTKKINVPTLVVVVDNDTTVSTDNTLTVFENLDAPKKLVSVHGEHFSPWLEQFDVCCDEQIRWFKKYL
jgi:dienelactone hydrolase